MTEREFTAAAERHLDTVYRVALNVSVKAEDGLKRQRRYEILILEKS